jgi:type VI secretion system protein ImpE
MADANDLLRDGDLGGTRAALIEIVRSQPSNEQARMFLFQLLAVLGEWDKARNQLQSLAQLSPEAQMLAVTYNQAMDAEKQRAAIFAGAAEMPLLAGDGGWASAIARSIGLLGRGDVAGAIAARDESFENAPDMPGVIDGQRFEWLADADSRFGPTCEAIVGGKYGLIPFDEIASIKSEGPRDLRDTVWYPIQLALRSGQSAAAFLPGRYPGSETASQDDVRSGRVTNWIDREWGQEGAGQRLWTFSEGDDRGLMDLRSLVFD